MDNLHTLQNMILSANALAAACTFAADAARYDSAAAAPLPALLAHAQAYAQKLHAAAFDLVDPEAAADDENLFSLHLRATEAADNLQKIAESLQK